MSTTELSTTEQKLEAFEGLVNEASAALADLVDILRDRGQDDAIASALADIEQALAKRSGVDMAPVAAAIRELRQLPQPVVKVDVHPAPVHVHSLLKEGGEIEMRMPSPAGGRDKVVYLRYIPPTSK